MDARAGLCKVAQPYSGYVLMTQLPEGKVGEKEEACPFCKGTGRCGSCDGKNHREVRRVWFTLKRMRLCGVCHGYGTCNLCHGTRKQRADP